MAEKRQETTVKTIVGFLSARPISTHRPITIPEIIHRISKPLAHFSLFALITAVVILTGCAPRQRKVVATWRGESTGQTRTNERILLSLPTLEMISDAEQPGVLQIATKQKQFATFDLEEHYEKVGAVRNLSPEQVKYLKGDSAKSAHTGVFLGGMWLVPPVGASLTAGAAAIDRKKAKKRDEAQTEVIQKLTDGESAVTIPVDYRWRTLDTEFKREIVGEELELTGAGSEETEVAAAQVQLKIVNVQHPSHRVKGHTDDSGRVSFGLAGTLAEAAQLRTGKWKVSAKWDGKWQEVGTVQVGREWINEVVRGLREQKLHATGKTELPPAATMSLKVSNGVLRAGIESDIALTVLNTGLGEFYRLVATTESDVPALNGLTFDFGKLAAEEGLTLVKRIRIHRQQRGASASVRFRWSELNGYAPIALDAEIPIKAPTASYRLSE